MRWTGNVEAAEELKRARNVGKTVPTEDIAVHSRKHEN
jgi:hypothetical protein